MDGAVRVYRPAKFSGGGEDVMAAIFDWLWFDVSCPHGFRKRRDCRTCLTVVRGEFRRAMRRARIRSV